MVLFDLKPEISEAILDCLPRLMYWFNGPALFVSCGLFNLCFSFLLSSNKLSDLVRFYTMIYPFHNHMQGKNDILWFFDILP